MVAVRPEGKGNLTDNGIVWSDHKSVSKKASMLVIDGLIYMNSDDGVLTCREASTGDLVWQERAGGSFAASPIYASGRIYFFSMEGVIFTVSPGREFKRLAKTELGDGFLASPAVVNNDLILRSRTELFCIAKP